MDAARRANPAIDESIWAFLDMLLRLEGDGSHEAHKEHAAFTMRFQQLTGPVMAKAVEDTAFYRYTRLFCLNEVGGLPSRYGTSSDEFHRLNRERARSFPLSMVTTSTHDTKRGEDASARIAVLTELPGEWRRAVERWSEIAERNGAPTAGIQYLFFQVVIGAWPFGWDGHAGRDDFVSRIDEFMQKAGREAKQETSWLHSDAAHEARTSEFIRRMFENESFVSDVRSVFGTHRLLRSYQRACSVCAAFRGARRRRYLPRFGALESESRRSGQSAPGRLRHTTPHAERNSEPIRLARAFGQGTAPTFTTMVA